MTLKRANQALFLDSHELATLTDRKRPRGQIEWLCRNGYPFELSAVGRPKVLREEVERRLLSKRSSQGRNRPRLELVS